jgi:RecA/RadA recombinase
MTISLNGNDIGQMIEIAATVGSIVATLIVGFIIYLVVRPSRRDRYRRAELQADPRESEEMWRLVDRMEARLETLERALADQIERPRERAVEKDTEDRLFAPADHGRDSGRNE